VIAIRLAYTVAVMSLVVWLLLAGRFGQAVAVAVIGVWVRRSVERGRLFARSAPS